MRPPPPNPPPGDRIYAAVNVLRAAHRLPPLAFLAPLYNTGLVMATIAGGLLAGGTAVPDLHNLPGQPGWTDFVGRAGYRWAALAQNAAYNSGTPDPVGTLWGQWLGSPEHLANFLDRRVTRAGVGIVTTGRYCVGYVTMGAP